ncbi:MAG: metallophosphoesterase family protein [Thermoplasmata archaeon]|nr:MAG: phosphodiesterase [Aciduliprofundum sp.]
MIFLVMSDIHSAVTHHFIEEIAKEHGAEAVILLGDLTNFGPSEFILNLSPKDLPVFAIPGNCDPPEIFNYFSRANMINMHKNTYDFADFRLVGLGGADYSFINIGIGYTDDIAYNFLVSRVDNNTALMLHQPPYGILDKVHEKHAGNRGIRKAIDEKRPFLVMSGHIHEERGMVKIGDTLFFNPGPAKEGYFAILKIEDRRPEVKLLKR